MENLLSLCEALSSIEMMNEQIKPQNTVMQRKKKEKDKE